MTLYVALDGVTSFLRLKTLQIHVNVCDVVGVLQCKGGKMEDTEDFKFIFVVYCAIKSK